MVFGLKQLKLAAGLLAGVAKAGDQTGIATAIDLVLKTTDLGETLRKQDRVAVALREVSVKLEAATRKALSAEFGADWESKPDLAATLAALPDVLERYAPDTDAIFAENLDPERIARRATDAAEAAHDDLFRRNTVGERLLFAVIRQTYVVTLADKDFALQMILHGQGEMLKRVDQLKELYGNLPAARSLQEIRDILRPNVPDIQKISDEQLPDIVRRILEEASKPGADPTDFSGAVRRALEQARAARTADAERLRIAQRLLLTWRKAYGQRVDELTAAAAKARALQKHPLWGEDTRALIRFAAKVARDLDELPVSQLDFARHSGLNVHPLVFSGKALRFAKYIDEFDRTPHGSLRVWRLYEEETYEILERVLDSAAILVDFAPKYLPLGYATTRGLGAEENLSDVDPLVLVDAYDDPTLKLMELGESLHLRGSFAARHNRLRVYAAQKMTDGTLEIFGTDSQFDYRWSASGGTPVAEYPNRDICAAAFASSRPGASLIVVAKDGLAEELMLDGSSNPVTPPLGTKCIAAKVWQNPLDTDARYLLRLSNEGTLSSHRFGSDGEGMSTDLTRLTDSGPTSLWGEELHICELEGFPCVAATLKYGIIYERVVHFLHPITHQPIRPARRIDDDWADFRVALGRWLVATRITNSGDTPLLTIWDLGKNAATPLGQWCVERGFAYAPLVVSVGRDEFFIFFTLQLHRERGGTTNHLCRFHFPSFEIKRLLDFPGRFYPVSNAFVEH